MCERDRKKNASCSVAVFTFCLFQSAHTHNDIGLIENIQQTRAVQV